MADALFAQMARPLRIEYPGAVYHLTSRGNAQEDIFRDDADRRIFLRLLGSTVTHFGWLLYAYCLMGNHYHLLAETPAPNLSRAMRQLNGTYTQHFNRRHDRVGHVFQGRFTSILVERETYLLELARYVTLNPVRAGLAPSPGQWPWSSYRATAGLEGAASWLCIGPLLERLSGDAVRAGQRYEEFVLAGVGLAAPWSGLRGQALLGTEQFAARLRATLSALPASSEVPRAERLAGRPPLDLLLPLEKLSDRAQRNAAIREASKAHGYTLAEIARHTGLHYATVSRIATDPMQQFKT